MQCAQYKPDIPDYVTGNLPEAERARLEAHLGVCTKCSALAREFAPVLSAPRTQPAPVDPMVFARMRVNVNERIDSAITQSATRWRLLTRSAWMSLAPAALAVALVVVFNGRESTTIDRAVLHRDLQAIVTSLDDSQMASLAAEHQVPVSLVDTRFESAAVSGRDTNLERTITDQFFADLPRSEVIHAGTEYLADTDALGVTGVSDSDQILEQDAQQSH